MNDYVNDHVAVNNICTITSNSVTVPAQASVFLPANYTHSYACPLCGEYFFISAEQIVEHIQVVHIQPFIPQTPKQQFKPTIAPLKPLHRPDRSDLIADEILFEGE